jgi:ribonuclease P protein component
LVKRQIREAYRKNKGVLWDVLKEHSKALSLAFIWLDDEIHESAEVEKKVVNLLLRVKEKLPELL